MVTRRLFLSPMTSLVRNGDSSIRVKVRSLPEELDGRSSGPSGCRFHCLPRNQRVFGQALGFGWHYPVASTPCCYQRRELRLSCTTTALSIALLIIPNDNCRTLLPKIRIFYKSTQYTKYRYKLLKSCFSNITIKLLKLQLLGKTMCKNVIIHSEQHTIIH